MVLDRTARILAAATLAGSGSAASTLGTTTPLTTDVVHYLSVASLLGPVPSSQTITVGVVLNNPNNAAENAYLAQLYDPGSSNYQQFLDPDQFNAQFGVPATTVSAAQTWLSGAGLTVTAVEGATNYLLASGTAAQVSAAFGTPLNRYSAGGRTFYANSAAPTLPDLRLALGAMEVPGPVPRDGQRGLGDVVDGPTNKRGALQGSPR